MPALYLFGRRTLLAGDDLQLPSLAGGALAAAQLFLCLPYLLYSAIDLLLTTAPDGDDYDYGAVDDDAARTAVAARRRLDADDALDALARRLPRMGTAACARATSGFSDFDFPRLLLVYLVGVAIYGATSLWHEQRIFRFSSLGTPTRNLRLRAPLRDLIETKLTFLAGSNCLLLAYGLTVAGVHLVGYGGCFPVLWWLVLLALFASQAAQCLLGLTTLASLWRVRPTAPGTTDRPAGAYQRHLEHPHAHGHVEMAEELWQIRCEGCCRLAAVATCFPFGGRGIVASAAEGRGGETFYGDTTIYVE